MGRPDGQTNQAQPQVQHTASPNNKVPSHNGATACATAGVLYGVILFSGACFVYSYLFRAKMRNKYGLPDAPAPDWITHLVCMQCALCQEYRELKHHGFNPILGWAGNVQQAQQQEMMTPPTSQRMMG
ncbi:PLAC8 motif-containing protein [Arabidopsis thaliana x Arabidopsis arenosa]|uniref:PLAC8 motif-containing protein n=1 Tax=Arabidopsis thaliana x Arabidopsis arenosa TaxID=1240361 RepID=A0A8T2AYB1_9BRAS|nr:PLAC8 motif-containing protein [Arabidopsis thaliana x Arabidopsis arenosa]